jgi:MFS family permease
MLSDHFGRKPAIIGSFLVTVAGWLVLAFSGDSLPLVFAGSILAGGSAGSAILIMNVIPGESAPGHLKATAMGLNAAFGELLGAGVMPVVIGWAADKAGLGILPWLVAGFAVLTILVTLGLRETAPRLVPGLLAASPA